MSTYYFDTSALIKRYVNEPGSDWIKARCDPQARNILVISDLTVVEFASTLARRQREGTVSEPHADVLTDRFLTDFKQEYLSISLDSKVVLVACDRISTSSYSLRSLDAIQLAYALEARVVLDESIVFVSADKRLLEAAAGHGFDTDNPNDHL